MLYVWYPKGRTDLNTIHEENDVIGLEELARVKAELKWGKHTCLIMRMEHPRAYEGCYKTPIKRFQNSYESPINSYKSLINLLARDYKTPIKRLQDS